MYKVGLTGGIGSGKTTIARIWKKKGAFVLDADDFAKELMVTDSDIIEKIKESFGEEAYKNDQSLNRSYLAKEAFEKGRVDELNKIVHPRVFEKTEDKIEEAEQEGYKVFVKEAALLLNYGRPESLDKVVLVLATDENMIKRAAQRDNVSPDVIQERLDKQQDFEKLKSRADFVIHNNGSMEDLEMRAQILFEKFLERA